MRNWHWSLSFYGPDEAQVVSIPITAEQANRLLDTYAPTANREEPAEILLMPDVFLGAVSYA